MRVIKLILIFCITSFGSHVQGQYKSSSVLNEGSFYKFSVSNSGIHKLDLSFFENLPNVGSIIPENISIFGNRGGMLPEVIADERVDDLEELPLHFVGNNDNIFSSNEYFLFYAEGPSRLTYNDESFEQKNNVYEVSNFYFISTNRARQNQIIAQNSSDIPQQQINTYDDYQKHDNDLVNLLGDNFGTQGSGKVWYGEEFTNDRIQEFSQEFDFDNIVDGSDIKFKVEMAARSDKTSTLSFRVNSAQANLNLSKVSLFDTYGVYATHRKLNLVTAFDESTGVETVQVEMKSSSSRFSSWLDHISMRSEKHLRYTGKAFNFRKISSDTQTPVQYNLSVSQGGINVWNVSNPHDVVAVNVTTNGSQSSFIAPAGQEFVVFSEDEDFPRPNYITTTEVQNVHAIMDAEYVILYHSDFETSALRLAAHRSSHDDLITYVIDVDKVFNEFGGGSKDPIAIRDFARMLFKRSGTFQYLCLLGDATYDYRGIDSELPPDNFLPCYQTDESLSPVFGFPTDDFYALLSDNEGGDLKGGLDIAVGRLPVASVQEAETVVDKLIGYDIDPEFDGEWKNNFILVADDEDGNSHLNQTERLAASILQDRPEFNQRKVYFDAFQQQSTTGDDRYPDAKQKLNDYIFQGSLLLNYFGHGGPNGWAQERVLEIQDILTWTNAKRLPLFITATCTFTGYDDPADKSGGELTLLNPNGGSIGLVSTTRAVTISANERLVNSLFEYIYDRENDQFLRMGEVLRLAKNNHRSDTLERNARKFALIGDPAFRLSFPEYQVNVTSFQGNPVGTSSDTIRALDEVIFTGEILGFSGEKLNDFSGELEVTVMDKAQTFRTLANDSRSFETNYKAHNATIFKGKTGIENGEFTVSFRVPKDIDYEFGNGRLSLYASENGSQTEASGYYDKFVIGGTSTEVVEDDQPPEISLFINNEFFRDGGVSGPDPLLIAQVSDNLGINISNTSIGHEMIAILDEDLPNQIILNDYYQASPNSFTQGVIEYPFKNLEDGPHTIRVRVWDVANNSAEARLNFIVEKGQINLLENVSVLPNPAIEEVEFSFTHQLNFAPVKVFIQIYNQLGQPVSELTESVTTGGNAIENISWSRIGYGGATLAPGVYYYKITATADSGDGDIEMATSPGGKIVLLN